MDHKRIHDQASVCEIQSWENEGGALAQEAGTAFTMNRLTALGANNFGHALDGHRPAQPLAPPLIPANIQ